MQGSEHPHVTRKLHRASPKVNVWCGIICNKIIVHFSSTRHSLLHTNALTLWPNMRQHNWMASSKLVHPRTGETCLWVLPPNISGSVDWKGWVSPMATTFIRHHSFGLLSMGLCERYRTDLKQRISDATVGIGEDMPQRTWQEIEYRLDVLYATNGGHTAEH